jgi:hypothetical protein
MFRASETYKIFQRQRELIKCCAIKPVNAFSDIKIAEKLKPVSLSHQTVSRRVNEMADNVSGTLRCVTNDCEYYSLGLNESIGNIEVC